MVRTVLIPDSTHIELDIPKEYVGKQIEVTYLSLDELDNRSKSVTMADFWGTLSNETRSDLQSEIKNSRDEWQRDI